MKKTLLIIIVLLISSVNVVFTLPITVGLIKHDAGSIDSGYVLFAPCNSTTTYLIDKCGYVVHSWANNFQPGLSVYFLPNGKLLKTGVDTSSPFYTGGGGGYIEIVDWDGNVEWQYKLSTQTECQHHDVKYMPNGNILVIVWEKKTFEELGSVGRNPDYYNNDFWSEKIQELRPIGKDSAEIVWEWKVWDHLVQDFDNKSANYGVPSENPQLMDINFRKGPGKDPLADWLHFNSLDYNPTLNQIVLCSPFINEIWIIDHSTSTEEASTHTGGKYGKGGDILYRWGNPAVYKNGNAADQKLFYQHDVTWIPDGFPFAGGIMVFNNWRGPTSAKYSSVDIISTPLTESGSYNQTLPYGPSEPIWSYIADGFYAKNLSGAQLLINGSVLICNGPSGTFFEIDPDKKKVWEYINPITQSGPKAQGSPALANDVFRCTFYPKDYPGFDGKDLTQKGIIENENENSENCELAITVEDDEEMGYFQIYPNPANEILNVETELALYKLIVRDIQGNIVIEQEDNPIISTKTLVNGMFYIYLVDKDGNLLEHKKIIVRR